MVCCGKDCQTSVHGTLEGLSDRIPCRLFTCERLFTPKRKDQVFCTAEHREEYYIIARDVGVAALEALRRRKDG